jgi:zinc transporter, ZIP family
MESAFIWGLLATSSLVVGGSLGMWVDFSRRTLGIIMAFGAGVLLSAVAYELTFDALRDAAGSGFPALGFLVGALTFFFIDMLIGKIGARGRKAIDSNHHSGLVVPLVLAIILDGIPESAVLGLGIRESGQVSAALLVAVFISNLPEAIASTNGMKAAGWGRLKVQLLWVGIALTCALTAVAGYALLGTASVMWLSFIKMFAAGAILVMLANTMMPEAYAHGGKLAGLFTVLGFGVSVGVIMLEHAAAH